MINKYCNYSDKELLTSMQSSQKSEKEEAFLEVYNRYNRIIYTYIIRILNNSEEASDIFQDVFVKIIDIIEKKQEVANLKNILITIARNLSLNQIKKRKEVYVENLSELVIDENVREDNDLMKILHRGMDMLEGSSKDLLLLKYYDGLSYDELQEITGLSTTVLKNKVWRAKEKLKKILTPYLKDIKEEIEN